MQRRVVVRSVLLLVAVCAFATVEAIVEGDHGGTRHVVGNVSAPWALLPFLAGAFVRPRRPAIGALIGSASAVVALACDGLVRTGAFRTTGGHRDMGAAVASAAGNRWFLLGAIGGAAFGAGGSWLAARRRWGVVTGVVAATFVLEPVGRMLWAVTQGDAVRTFVPIPSCGVSRSSAVVRWRSGSTAHAWHSSAPRHGGPGTVSLSGMCRNITTLRGLQPIATPEEIEAAARQYVRKVGGVQGPTARTEDAFERAVHRVAAATADLLRELPARRVPPPTLPPLRRRAAANAAGTTAAGGASADTGRPAR